MHIGVWFIYLILFGIEKLFKVGIINVIKEYEGIEYSIIFDIIFRICIYVFIHLFKPWHRLFFRHPQLQASAPLLN